jgi:hypothetical protein
VKINVYVHVSSVVQVNKKKTKKKIAIRGRKYIEGGVKQEEEQV